MSDAKSGDSQGDLKQTPLHDLHVARGGKMVPFAGYAMPVQYAAGILAEHKHTRAKAGLFDVSHMGQVRISGGDPAAAMEALVPGDIKGLPAGQMRYTQLTNEVGGILDDLMITNFGDHLFAVFNAACKAADTAHVRAHLPAATTLETLEDRALLALQGPAAAAVLARHADCADMVFMQAKALKVAGIDCLVSRSGYTGEDGFEISVPNGRAVELAERLLGETEVLPIGLGARDSLRLEAGLCLYGHDIDETTTPVEAALTWSIGKRRREEGGFPGADVIQKQLQDGVSRRRVGIKPAGRAPAREGTGITDPAGNPIGTVTSGGFGPTVDGPVAMGYVAAAHAKAGTPVGLTIRGKRHDATVAPMPFVPQRYYRGK
jgi:aminomethyltransferase